MTLLTWLSKCMYYTITVLHTLHIAWFFFAQKGIEGTFMFMLVIHK